VRPPGGLAGILFAIGVLLFAIAPFVLAQRPPAGDGSRRETPDGAASTTPDSASPVKVRFVEPGTALLEGTIRITVEASTSDDARIVSVSVFADDRLLTTLEKAPYTFTWDSGRGAGLRRLRAVAEDSLGRKAETVLVSRRIGGVQYEEVRLVQVYAAVRDAKGRPVTNLERDAFTLFEDGVPQSIATFATARLPITIALLIDTSSSMRLNGRIDLARRGAETFVDAVAPEDRLVVLSFDDVLKGDREPTTDRRTLKQRIGSVAAGGGTALYDALFQTAETLTGLEGRRAIVLLSDGRDQALTENEPGSLHVFEEALERVQRSDAAVYAIGLGPRLDQEMDLERRRTVKDLLETLAAQTGGHAYFTQKPSALEEVYRQVAADLKDQYLLAYAPGNSARDGRWRAIDVKVKDPALRITARPGYFAPGAPSAVR
jgi:Ca-activated chloride channel family protein